ncbi:MAG: hypothetical protein JW827_11525 [Spirochaetes bacterium]|nr:hypothetical protein [Spirochaetota bacterium]
MILNKYNTFTVFLYLIILLVLVNTIIFYFILGPGILLILMAGIMITAVLYFIMIKSPLSSGIKTSGADKQYEIKDLSESDQKMEKLEEKNYFLHKRIILIQVFVIFILLLILIIRLLSAGG